MRAPLTPIKAFLHDADQLGQNGRGDAANDARLPRWLSVAQSAERLAALAPLERAAYLETLAVSVLPPRAGRPTQITGDGRIPTDTTEQLAERLRLEAEDMERAGCFQLALTTVSAVCQMLATGTDASLLLAIAHLGRVIRQLGDLDSAADCYRTVTDEAAAAGDGAVAAHGFIGLGNVAYSRGNRPDQKSYFQKALDLAARGSPTELSAHQGLIIVANNQHDLADALLHGWRAHDLAPPDSEVQLEILSNMANTVLEAGFYQASLAGFEYVLQRTFVTRLRIPAIGGAIRAAARGGHHSEVARLERLGRAEMLGAAAPLDTARLQLWTAEAWHQLEEHSRVEALVEESLHLADAHGFHELRIRGEALLAAARHASAAVREHGTYLAEDGATVLRHGIDRLAALAV